MRKGTKLSWVLVVLASLSLAFVACDDEDPEDTDTGVVTDTGTDQGMADQGMTDQGMTDQGMGDQGMGDQGMGDMGMGGDTEEDTVEDTGMAIMDQCVNETDTPLVGGEDGTIRSALGVAIPVVASGPCLTCATNPDCDTAACVADYIDDYQDGDRDDADEDAAIQAVRDSGVTDGCMGCYAGITTCVLGGGCAFGGPGCATDNTTCACLECQCTAGCGEAFATCSGLPSYLECDALEDGDGNVCE